MKRRPPRSTRPDKLFPDLRVSDLRIKSYHDYGTFTPIQVASIAALEGPQECVSQVVEQYRNRRDVLAKGLHEAGWMVDIPKASMYIWRSEEHTSELQSLMHISYAVFCLKETNIRTETIIIN